MPEVLFTVQLPDGGEENCYSPSTVVREYFERGEEMPLAEFVSRSREALSMASERVRAKYGMGCSSAMDQLATIVGWGKKFPPEGMVRILDI